MDIYPDQNTRGVFLGEVNDSNFEIVAKDCDGFPSNFEIMFLARRLTIETDTMEFNLNGCFSTAYVDNLRGVLFDQSFRKTHEK